MIADRSPGERSQGSLATLKPKRQSAPHEHALAKVRGPVPPASPFAALVSGPPVPPIVTLPTAPAPLFNLVSGLPVVVPPTAIAAGGPPVVTPPSNVIPGGPGGGGGGGGVIVPPSVVTPLAPVTPVTPAVPEPTTWAMMLVGFALMGRAIRRGRRAAPQASAR